MAKKRASKFVSFPAEVAWRRNNTSRLLYSAAWLFDMQILAIVNRNGFPDIRMAHLHLPRNLDVDGTRLTELAKRAEMSKQAMCEIVDQCEAMGLIERQPDEADRRAKVVVFTARGRRLIELVHKAVSLAERGMLAHIGAKQMENLRSGLMIYCDESSAIRKAHSK
jgi:DNA-binding MarR family transcriptional regulator